MDCKWIQILSLLAVVQTLTVSADLRWWKKDDDDNRNSISRWMSGMSKWRDSKSDSKSQSDKPIRTSGYKTCFGRCPDTHCCSERTSSKPVVLRYGKMEYWCQSKANENERCDMKEDGYKSSCNECAPGLYCKSRKCVRKVTAENRQTRPRPTRPRPTRPITIQSTPKPTQKPTTAKPTTAKPTTAKPTTAKPTTAKPTTAKPTTAKPTTIKPTTVAREATNNNQCPKTCPVDKCCATKAMAPFKSTGSKVRDTIRYFWLKALYRRHMYDCAPVSKQGELCNKIHAGYMEPCGCGAGLMCDNNICVKDPGLKKAHSTLETTAKVTDSTTTANEPSATAVTEETTTASVTNATTPASQTVTTTVQNLTTAKDSCPEKEALKKLCFGLKDAIVMNALVVNAESIEDVFLDYCDESGLVPTLWDDLF